MVAREYVPDAGDLLWLDFASQAGREQAGRRPAVVLSHRSYNEKTSLAVVCPITSHANGYPFEVPIPPGLRVGGVILSDHLKISIGASGKRKKLEKSHDRYWSKCAAELLLCCRLHKNFVRALTRVAAPARLTCACKHRRGKLLSS